MHRSPILRFALVAVVALVMAGSWLGCADIIGLDDFDFDVQDAGDGGDSHADQ